MMLQSERYDFVDPWDWLELAYQEGWTDGLPVAPPTPARVEAMLAYVQRGAQEELGTLPPGNGVATMEKLAINAVMAGCKPEYFPVVIAAIEAMQDPAFNMEGVLTTAYTVEPLVIVSGPIVRRLGFNCGDALWGSNARANTALGRAVRLILHNVAWSIPGRTKRTPLSHPGRYCFCIAEDMDNSPWSSFHVDGDLPQQDDAVTVFGADSPHNLYFPGSLDQVLCAIADAMAIFGHKGLHSQAQHLLVLCPPTAKRFASAGWTKRDLQMHLFEHARRSVQECLRAFPAGSEGSMRWPRWISRADPDARVPVAKTPDDIRILVGGGAGVDVHGTWVGGWGDNGGFFVTRRVTSPQMRPA